MVKNCAFFPEAPQSAFFRLKLSWLTKCQSFLPVIFLQKLLFDHNEHKAKIKLYYFNVLSIVGKGSLCTFSSLVTRRGENKPSIVRSRQTKLLQVITF